MKTGFYFFARLLFAWVASFLLFLLIWSTLTGGRLQFPLFLAWLVVMIFVITAASSHLRRVRLINGDASLGDLANRQRRQIEIPFEPSVAFAILEATVRDLPRVEQIQTAPDSLQIRAKTLRVHPYGEMLPIIERATSWLSVKHDLIFATITPHGNSGSITLICEPEGGAWRDWFSVDNGANLENAEAICRAVSRRIADRRRSENDTSLQTSAEKALAVAKLGLLHAQIEPHFLYNTLGSAKYLVSRDPVGAEAILDNLILYLRHSLPRVEETRSTLGEELARAIAYLDILKIRMGSRLQTKIDIPDALKSVPFPTMMLQTLVENAIKHGLEPKTGGGNIWVLANVNDENVAVTVADDGCGFQTQTSDSGIGLSNLRERLKLAYADRASFRIVANFPTGVAATITVPVNGYTPVEVPKNV